MNIRILDFDGSLTKQKSLLAKHNPEIINLRDFSSSARLWMSRKIATSVKERVKNTSGRYINLIGSGDFHHLSSVILDDFKEPVSLIVFDFHPDWDILPPFIGCGSWVTRALRNPFILKTVLLGPSSADLSFPLIQTANFNSLRGNRVEIYPYALKDSRVFLRQVPLNRSIRTERTLLMTKIFWKNIQGLNLKDFLSGIIEKLPTKNVYVSVDKDCLKNEYALTNWEEGLFSLDELLMMLSLIRDKLNLIGADITGEYSACPQGSFLKSWASRLDHPKIVKARNTPPEEILAINENTNIRILSVLAG